MSKDSILFTNDSFTKKVRSKLLLKFKYFLRKYKIKISPDSYLGGYTRIGKGTNINGKAFINSSPSYPCTIGKYCAIGHNLRIRVSNHCYNYANLQNDFQKIHHFPNIKKTKGEIIIGNNVWIADNVIILTGVHIGDGAIVGAGAVVTKSIPPFAIAVGNPAKIMKYRLSDTIIKQLLQLQWWEWDDKKIIKNRKFFSTDLTTVGNIDSLLNQ